MSIPSVVLLLLILTWATVVVVGTTPGDEEDVCLVYRADGFAQTPAYSRTMRVLMDSWNYLNLLPPHAGAVWIQVDDDMNNPQHITTNVSTRYSKK